MNLNILMNVVLELSHPHLWVNFKCLKLEGDISLCVSVHSLVC